MSEMVQECWHCGELKLAGCGPCPDTRGHQWGPTYVAVSTEETPLTTDRVHLTVYRVLGDVDKEMQRQDTEHAPSRHMSDFEWLAKIGEEYGEMCRAANGKAGVGHDIGTEATQLAALCGQLLKDLKRQGSDA